MVNENFFGHHIISFNMYLIIILDISKITNLENE